MRNLTPGAVTRLVLAAVSFVVSAGITPARAQDSGRPDGLRFVPNVPEQFAALTVRPDALGFHIGASPNPSSCKHYQAITRVDAADGTPFFFVTRSGNTPDDVPGELCDDSPGETGKGNLIVVRMGSRDKNGERLRSNRLEKNHIISGTQPPASDTVVKHLSFDGTNGLPNYGHAGGMQAVGHILAVAMEHRYDVSLPRSAVLFFDVSNPEAPVLRSRFSTEAHTGDKAGVVAVTPLPNGRYLMVVAGGDGDTFVFYRSTLTDLGSPNLNWEFVTTAAGPDVQDAHQTLNFLREKNIRGRLYLAAARGKYAKERDYIDLYRVVCDTLNCAPGEQIHLSVRTQGQPIYPYPSFGMGDRLVNLAAASGFYVSPSGEIIFYATEHDNDGPGGTVKAGEWRHVDMVRENSPTLAPTPVVDGPLTIDEGHDVYLTGVAKPPITKAWIQLYNSFDFGPNFVTIDHDDYFSDNFNALWVLDPNFPSYRGFANNNASWRWFAPPGCKIFTTALDGTRLVAERTLTGGKGADADLRGVLDDEGRTSMYQIVDSTDFQCDEYYDGPFELHWDLNRDGVYEAKGNFIGFEDIAVVDGPAVITIPVKARHPLGGPEAETTAKVVVRNVSPRVTGARLFNSVGQLVNGHLFPGQVPSVLVNLSVTVEADFVDPGINDEQTATIDWGDGVVQPNTVFRTFDDAFVDTVGSLSHAHQYTTVGARRILISVRDDDGGVGTKAIVFNVIGPAQVIEAAVARLDTIIAATSDDNARQHLLQAREALAGVDVRVKEGALLMIALGNDEAAIALLNQAIASLQNAQVGGVASMIGTLQQAISSLAAGLRK